MKVFTIIIVLLATCMFIVWAFTITEEPRETPEQHEFRHNAAEMRAEQWRREHWTDEEREAYEHPTTQPATQPATQPTE